MLEDYAACQQRYAAIGIGAFCTIFQVAFYGASHAGELAAYLVVAAGFQVYFEQKVSLVGSQQAVGQLGQLRAGACRVIGDAFGVVLVASEDVQQCALVGGR